jgi:hydrogenase maturation factor HypE
VPEPVLTREQQKQALDENIAGIKELMNNSAEGMTEAEIQEQQKAWKELLDLLENEKRNLDAGTESQPPDSSQEKKQTKEGPEANKKK